jgi:hypothetical protein
MDDDDLHKFGVILLNFNEKIYFILCVVWFFTSVAFWIWLTYLVP